MEINLDKLSLQDFMLLRHKVNTHYEAITTKAHETLSAGENYPGFALTEGKKTRYIKDEKGYRAFLENTFMEDFAETCLSEKLIPFSTAEKLIKDIFDKSDALQHLNELKKHLDVKVAPAKLTYVGGGNQ